MTSGDLYDHVKKGRARASRAPWGSHHLGAASKRMAAAAGPKAGAKVGAGAGGKALGGAGAKLSGGAGAKTVGGGGGCKLPTYLAMISGAIKELGERGEAQGRL